MKQFGVIFSICLFLIIGVSCSNQNKSTSITTDSKQSEQNEFDVPITLIVNEKEVNKKTVSATNKESVLELCQKVYDIKDNHGFVTAIDGISQEMKQNRYWLFYINDKEATKGANDVTVTKGDKIEWRLNGFK